MQPRTQTPPRRHQISLFARNFFRHPRLLGSVIPSSRYLTARALGGIDWQRAKVIVEYGPGVGAFTGEILRRMRSDAILVAIEMNPEFVTFLRRSYPDPRLHVVDGSAADVAEILAERQVDAADYVISGIPFSTLPDGVREDILRKTREILRADGQFIVYQFSPRVLTDLRRIFSRVTTSFEPLNVLPARVFYCVP
jgi:phospholipid N-methyltransferase